MTQDEKVALLKEAGVWDVIGYPSCIDKLFDLVAAHERERLENSQKSKSLKEIVERMELAIRADEREACAKACEELAKGFNEEADNSRLWCAAAIRARGEKQ